MNRDEARENFSAAFDGELGEARAAFDALLAEDAELREEYEEFAQLLRETQSLAFDEALPEAGGAPTPDLLAGVQRKLRVRSGGRYYRDRFSERSVRGLSVPVLVAALMLVVLVVWFVALNWTTVVEAPSAPAPAPRQAPR
jgi:hypothetical protein